MQKDLIYTVIQFMKKMICFSLFILLNVPLLLADNNEECLSCHGEKAEGIPYVNVHKFQKSIHGKNLCVSCHEDAKELPHAEKLNPVSCKNCHRIESSIYLNSDHGKAISNGMDEAATCTSCHGKTHTLLSYRNPKSPVYRKNIPQTCAKCHSDKEKMAGIKLSINEPFDTYEHSVHSAAIKKGKMNAAVCSDCHGTHDLHASSNPRSMIYRRNIPKTCGKCHENVREVYDQSVHGNAIKAGIDEAPVCTDCHGEHTIRPIIDPASTVYAGAITKTCSGCHASEKINIKFGLPENRLKTYQDSYHGLASRMGDIRAANCASCHGWHDILPASDTRSSIHPNNIKETCGKCHSGAKTGSLQGKIHGESKADGHLLTRYVRLFYLFLIPLLIGGMLIHNFADYFRKAISPALPHESSSKERNVIRLNRTERIQHIILTLTFIILAYSGFALKFPEHWWATPFQVMGGELIRKYVHRTSALIFSILSLYHIFYMILNRRGKYLLKHQLSPKKRDFLDPIQLIVYNLGLLKKKPTLPYPSYIEKSEYWALIWGSLIMIATGIVLVFNNLAFKVIPLWLINLSTSVHYYEAVLASLAILVWHSYWVIFDPDVYPMNKAWINGRQK